MSLSDKISWQGSLKFKPNRPLILPRSAAPSLPHFFSLSAWIFQGLIYASIDVCAPWNWQAAWGDSDVRVYVAGCACVRESRSGPWTASVSSTPMLIEVLCLQWRNASTWGSVCGKGRVVFLFFYLLLASCSVQVNTALGISITSLKIKQQRGQDLKY